MMCWLVLSCKLRRVRTSQRKCKKWPCCPCSTGKIRQIVSIRRLLFAHTYILQKYAYSSCIDRSFRFATRSSHFSSIWICSRLLALLLFPIPRYSSDCFGIILPCKVLDTIALSKSYSTICIPFRNSYRQVISIVAHKTPCLHQQASKQVLSPAGHQSSRAFLR